MPTCRVVVTLLEIQHAGSDIGDDWTYTAIVNGVRKVFDGSGYGAPGDRVTINAEWEIKGQECGSIVRVEISLKAKEEDFLFDDKGSKSEQIDVSCPEPQPPPLTGYFSALKDIKVTVKERPEFLLGQSNVTFKFKLESFCE